MQKKKKAFVALAVLCLIIAGTAATTPPEQKAKNLKVLPKDISHEDLEAVMHDFNKALGVKCNFCHAPKEGERGMDFASDAKPEKEMARSMMKMTLKLNKKYFGVKKGSLTDKKLEVTCQTCHHGDPHP